MPIDDEQFRGLRLPNTLDLPPSHTASMVGHFLKGMYADVLKEEHPRHLAQLIAKLEDAERSSMRASER
ncbi:hypothetical protein [Microvirga zambiensis]|uniref:hypothetical protein n=1 Tax=Microvirga zambiensis TaxID=1402137 RepID=UPI0019200F06|nr:hypothetical protein [Microvirga zambiensis]